VIDAYGQIFGGPWDNWIERVKFSIFHSKITVDGRGKGGNWILVKFWVI